MQQQLAAAVTTCSSNLQQRVLTYVLGRYRLGACDWAAVCACLVLLMQRHDTLTEYARVACRLGTQHCIAGPSIYVARDDHM